MDLLIEGLTSGLFRSIGFLLGLTLLPKVKTVPLKAKTALVDLAVRAALKMKQRKKR